MAFVQGRIDDIIRIGGDSTLDTLGELYRVKR